VRAIVATFGLCLFGATASVATAGGGHASIGASTYEPGAPVALTFRMSYPMQCADPGRTLTVRLPTAMHTPARIEATAVRVNGAVPKTVELRGSTVSIGLAEKPWISCDLVAMGNLSVVIRARAGLTNPKSLGIYSFPIAIDGIHGTPKLRIT
jgi:hypothetical protein